MADKSSTTLIGTAKSHWRAFAPFWAFPVFLMLGGAASHELGYLDLFFWLIGMPVFFWSFYRAVAACRRAQLPYWHAATWVVLAPLAVAAIAVYCRLLVLYLLGGEHAV